MPRADNLHELPESLPVPTDDGACDHLPGMRLPPVALPSTAGERVDLSGLPGRTVVY
ncbi:MAG: peroxiredoxin, partial [Actinomycetota bacterium]|nr:peroxiredoxin [Actinomycetota bacterium]